MFSISVFYFQECNATSYRFPSVIQLTSEERIKHPKKLLVIMAIRPQVVLDPFGFNVLMTEPGGRNAVSVSWTAVFAKINARVTVQGKSNLNFP